jgi:isoleucyl-tRNA synthetase
MSDDAEKPLRDYRETVFLPETPFPMRAGLPQAEPAQLERLGDLYPVIRAARQAAGAPLFVLHDGPPYANGAIHIGHALNKILKDFVVRSRFALGYDVDYVPGWDCHGLPIEWKIEEELRGQGRRKDEVSKAEFRQRCREYAAGWILEQGREFRRLGVLGDWDHRYSTMDFTSEAAIVAEFHKFIATHQLYRGAKPVMWSPVERTALADAEVEYHDHVSPTIWVRFPVTDGPQVTDHGGSVVIWTTTPWTIPGNRAIAYNPDIAYAAFRIEALEENLQFAPWARVGEVLVLAEKLAPEVMAAAKVAKWLKLERVDLQGVVTAHPLAALDPGYGFRVPLLSAEHPNDETGTGLVHTAPGHGAEDYQVWLAHGHREIPETVDEDGAYVADLPLFAGLKVLETEGKRAGKFGPANDEVIKALIEAGTLLARGRIEHSYPHSWRSKAPVIYRATPQWFVPIDTPIESQDGRTLREIALSSLDATAFYPAVSRNRIRSMVETRPDWLVSRQRAWGSPLAMFVDKTTGQPLHDDQVNGRIVNLIADEGADAWFTRPPRDFLGNHDPERYEKVEDILDVWFDSGSTHAFVLENRPHTHWPADLYLEGADQHRGWFQSSLLESSATRGRAPYDAVMTHGFTLDEKSEEKMSKSRGNAIEPQEVTRQSGAEILRLWSALVDYGEDQRIGPTVLQTTIDAYRKIRNTLRYLLGAVAGFTADEAVPLADMPPLERFILHRLFELDRKVRASYAAYEFEPIVRALGDFCSNDLSALFFDIRRDMLYCDPPQRLRRRAARTVMDLVFERLTVWLAPILAFTCEEAWSTRYPDAGPNAMRVFPQTPAEWENAAEAARWAKIERVTRAVTGALEVERRDKRIGASLEAAPVVHIADPELKAAFQGLDPAEIFRTSAATLAGGEGPADGFHLDEAAGVAVEPRLADGAKCARCWRVLPEVRPPAMLCERCEEAVEIWDTRAA